MAKQVTCRTVYEQTPVEDGTRVLVDRVWPQDISEEAARLDEWLSTVAPSAALQRSYSQDPLEYSEFRHRYVAELEDPEHRQAANHLRGLAEHTRLTLLTSAGDPHGGHVAVLAEWLARAGPAQSDPPSRGFRARVSSAVADLNAGAFSVRHGHRHRLDRAEHQRRAHRLRRSPGGRSDRRGVPQPWTTPRQGDRRVGDGGRANAEKIMNRTLGRV
ncbi:DUF488 family protein [Streptomyces sp. NPDC088921]|uniref:DUF488 domain-containing protein n=1 Tax=unclassified Streptomyces TaxID=2593676 RepID=UPI00342C0F7D